ncbi:Ig-like domain-containing protein [Bacillus sonorensis]|uniref:S8 family peptidase n=1 Tax=Bacillus sonorensis TaxID=119858 RepID=UPI002DB5B9A3|nr:Ig-like domain-containing protein [Bacillus sonorensis]MEC1502737.1 Ig-like domain-containing protein [Bacillus sonorensis]
MKKRKISGSIIFILMFALIFGQLPIVKAGAAADAPVDETALTIASPVKAAFKNNEEAHWYKVEPSEKDVADFTHFRFKLQSDQELNISIYSSLENATEGHTFDRYNGFSYEKNPGIIDFPVAWKGPYYVKVENHNDEETDNTSNTDVSYTISYEGVTLPPSDQQAEEDCPAELSVSERENGKSILQDLRTIRDGVLSKTEKGKSLSSLYYKAAPFISAKMIFDKSLRNGVYRDLVQLKKLFGDVAKNGSSSTYTITKEDQKAITSLYSAARETVPESLKKQLDETAEEIDIANTAGSKVSALFAKAGLTDSNISAAPENRYIVKLKDGKKLSSFAAKAKAFGAESVDSIKKSKAALENMYVLELDRHDSDGYKAAAKKYKAAADKLSRLPEVEFVEQVRQYRALSADSQYSYQWSLKNNGKDRAANADIQFEKLQKLLNGKTLNETVIAVVDTGVDHTLADLNGVVKHEEGYNYIGRNTNAIDDNGHGTHVSGIIAAAADNHYSMAGINAHAKILPVKVLDSSGGGDTEQIAYGIIYAVDHGAKVINLSLGGPYSRVIEYALKYAADKNVTVVAASGNDGLSEISYPASSKYALSVGATNQIDLVSDYSNYGKGLDMVAPGTDIPSLVPDGNVTYMSGTSMAAPHVAAVAGLLLSEKPSLKPKEVEKLLTETAADVSFEEQDNPGSDFDDGMEPEPPAPGYDFVSGWGRLNAYHAVSVLELKLKVNPILDHDRAVKGTAKSGSTVKVISGSKVLGTGTAGKSGAFSVKIPAQAANHVLHVVATGHQAEASLRAVVEKGPKKPSVKRVTNKDVYVKGTAPAGYTVNIKNKSKNIIGSAKADASGAFKAKIAKQKEYTILYATASADAYRESSEVKITVADVIPPHAPKINPVSDNSKEIKGKTEAGAQVTAKVKGKTIGSAKANGKGEYRLKIAKQKAGTTISVTAKDKAGNTSKTAKITVIDKTPPSTPKVYTVSSNSTAVKGKAEANANIIVKAGKKTIGTGKANKKGDFSIKIKKQKANTVLSVTAKDQAGNMSKERKTTVKKAK